jgi:beta-glucosidase
LSKAGRKTLLFLKKKKQKDFYEIRRCVWRRCTSKDAKVFWFFFSKKTFSCLMLLLCCAAPTPEQRAATLQAQLTQDERISLVHGVVAFPLGPHGKRAEGAIGSAGFVPGIARLGIPALQESDAGLGVADPADVRPGEGDTALPSGLAMAAGWDTGLAREAGAMIGEEAHRRGMNVLLAGGVNLARDPRNGRNFEYLGEDPLLAGRLDGAIIGGIQSRHVISTIKHFALNDQETLRTTANVLIGEQAARESDLLAFEIAIEDGRPGAVMCAYNLIEGAYGCDNDPLLNGVLKGDWHYPGWVMSDWGAVHDVQAAAHGLDQESGEQFDEKVFFDAPLRAAVADRTIPAARLQDMTTRILHAMFTVGIVDDPPVRAPIDAMGDAAVAQRVAESGLVLLRNEGQILPLSPNMHSIAIIGGHADRGVLSGGGSSQVVPVGGAALRVPLPGEGAMTALRTQLYDPSSPMAAIHALAPLAVLRVDDGRYPAEAADIAKNCDVAIVFVTQWMMEGYDAPDISLPEGQDALVAAVAAANPRTIVVLETGGAVAMPWLSKVGAVMEAWYPGARGGEVIADALFGRIDPAGRLPITFPVSQAQLPRPHIPGFAEPDATKIDVAYSEGADVGYRWFARQHVTPLFPFGFGLSYTGFSHAGLTFTDGSIPSARVVLKNTGTREGTDTAQLYLIARDGGEARRLLGWARETLRPGESKTVDIKIDPRLMADFDLAARGWHIPGGTYELALGTSSEDLPLHIAVHITDRRLPP